MNVCCCIEISRLIVLWLEGFCQVESDAFSCWGVFTTVPEVLWPMDSHQASKMAAHPWRNDAREPEDRFLISGHLTSGFVTLLVFAEANGLLWIRVD